MCHAHGWCVAGLGTASTWYNNIDDVDVKEVGGGLASMNPVCSSYDDVEVVIMIDGGPGAGW